jgi:hypothetical protein
MDKIKQVSEITDISLTAFCLYRGADVKPRTLPNGRIAFRVECEGLDAITDKFYDNPIVPLLDYLQYFKRVKTMIYNLGGTRR